MTALVKLNVNQRGRQMRWTDTSVVSEKTKEVINREETLSCSAAALRWMSLASLFPYLVINRVFK